MIEAINSILEEYRSYYADGVYLVLALFSYAYLFAHCPRLRKPFLAPMAVVMFLVLNPILYKYIYSQIIYWRLFWMFPTGLLIALAAVTMVRNSKGAVGKVMVLAMICGMILIKGMNIYTERGFGEIHNPEKVPGDVKEVCDIILGLEEEPRCIVPLALSSEVRQYSGEIKMLFGRDVVGYIIYAGEENKTISRHLESEKPNYEYILQKAVERGCDFVVTYADRPIEAELLTVNGYQEVEYDGNYRIYRKI